MNKCNNLNYENTLFIKVYFNYLIIAERVGADPNTMLVVRIVFKTTLQAAAVHFP